MSDDWSLDDRLIGRDDGGGTWVRRQAEEPQPHRCQPPMLRQGDGFLDVGTPDGHLDDLWRCDECRNLWRIASACDGCDRSMGHNICSTGLKWRPARLGQVLKAWVARR